MNYDEYLKERQKLNEALIKLDARYIEENSKFKKGDRVKIIGMKGDVRYAFVVDNKIKWDGEIAPILLKEKKDGTASKISDYLWIYETFEIVNKN